MPLIETESLVLKTYNLAEADRIVVFLTRDHGVVRGVAKGAKRLKSRFGSTLELFSEIDLSYFQKEERELVSIQKAELSNSYFSEAADPAFLNTFSYISDLLLQFTPPSDPNERLFRMMKACLAAASRDRSGLPAIQLYFELWLLRLGGYLPDWSWCDDCKTAFGPQDEASLRGGFQLHCDRCRKSSGVMQVSPRHREMFRTIQTLPPKDFITWAADRFADINDLSTVMKRLISQVLGKEHASSPPTELAKRNAI
jgi:DNA repair protein RecO (recombination protein O)